jgi:hypothetical protein
MDETAVIKMKMDVCSIQKPAKLFDHSLEPSPCLFSAGKGKPADAQRPFARFFAHEFRVNGESLTTGTS